MKLPAPQEFLNGLYVKYFEHKGKVCVHKIESDWVEWYTVFDNSPWYTKEDFFKRY